MPYRWRLIAGVLGVGLLTWLVLGFVHSRINSGWQSELQSIADGARAAKLKNPSAYSISLSLVMGEILPRPRWTRAEVDQLTELIQKATALPDAGRLDNPTPISETDAGILSAGRFALTAISTRFSADAPIDPDARAALLIILENALRSGTPRIRHTAVASVADSGLAEASGPLRAALEAAQDDPDPQVASNAKRQLEAVDKNRRRAGR